MGNSIYSSNVQNNQWTQLVMLHEYVNAEYEYVSFCICYLKFNDEIQ